MQRTNQRGDEPDALRESRQGPMPPASSNWGRTMAGLTVAEETTRAMTPTLAAAAAVLVALWLVPVYSALGQDPLSAAESAAKAGAETAEGKKFGEVLGQTFGREHGVTIQRCAKETKRPDLSDFDLFLRIDGAGVVEQAWVKPGTNLATCVQSKVVGWKTSLPPHAGFWGRVGVNLKRK